MKHLLTVGRIAVAVGLVIYLLSQVDIGSLYRQALSADIVLLLTGTVVLGFQPLVGAARWAAILGALGCAVPMGKIVRWTYIGVFFGQALPATVGTDGMRMWLAGTDTVGWFNAVVSVLLDRAVMLLVLVLLLAYGLPTLGRMTDVSWLTLLVPALLLGAVLGLGMLLFGRLLASELDRFRLVRALRALSNSTWQFVSNLQAISLTIALSVLSYLGLTATVLFFAQAFGARTNLLEMLSLLPPVLVASMLPVSLGGWGTRELAMVAALGVAGMPAGSALLASLWLGLASIIIALPGVVFFIARRVDLKAAQQADVLKHVVED